MTIRALIFDVFGTVVDWRSGVAREADAFFAAQGRADIDAYAFADAWRRQYQPSMEAVRSGARPFVPLDALHRENLDLALRGFGIDPATIESEALEDLNLAWHRLDPWPDSVAAIARLKKRYVVAPHSNGNIRLMIDVAKRSGLPWDAILGAEVAQAYKPSPESYRRVVDILMMRPAEVCLVAAHNDDLAPARRCGLRTAFIFRRSEHGSEQTTDLSPREDWDLAAEDLAELATSLGA